MVTNGTDSAGRTDVGGLGAGGRYLKGVRIEGLNSQPEGKIPLFIKNTNKDVYLRVEEGGITVEMPEKAVILRISGSPSCA